MHRDGTGRVKERDMGEEEVLSREREGRGGEVQVGRLVR